MSAVWRGDQRHELLLLLSMQLLLTENVAKEVTASVTEQVAKALTRVSFQQNQSGNSLSGAKKVCDKIWPKLKLKVLFMAKFALNKSC